MQLLFAKNRDDNLTDGYFEYTLQMALCNGHKNIGELLLAKDVDFNFIRKEYNCAF